MNRKKIFIVLAVVIVGVLFWWLLSQPKKIPIVHKSARAASTLQLPTTSPVVATPPVAGNRKAVVEKIQGVMATPITFYGKVIDQNGEPVSNANVGYSALDKFMESGSTYSGKSDKKGQFSITGIKGARLSVNVRKEGYYFIDGKSNAAFAYGTGPDTYFREPPTKENLAIFVLHKMGKTEPLIAVSSRTYRVQRNGTPLNVSLETGRAGPQGDFQVEAWTEDDKKDAQQHYNWRCRISVLTGGLVERKERFDFEAPIDGYKLSDEIVMPQTAERWQPQVQKEYFIKLADGRYGRIQFKMLAGGDHYFKLESFLNPKPGSRNLEFDPNKVVKP